mmetsp:Transcript_34002/g.77742  ORF Transcript_34002/g.77742 Transcript_34002/m.77742 type:complete len:87 (+) Transcript_34002:1213-1473(+)
MGQLRRASLAGEELIARSVEVEVDLKDTRGDAADDALPLRLSPMSEPPTKAAVKEEEAVGRLLNTDALAIVVEARSAVDLAIFMLE